MQTNIPIKCNKIGRTRDLFKEIREITGSFSARCRAMKGTLGKVVTEDKEVEGISKKYTEVLYTNEIPK